MRLESVERREEASPPRAHLHYRRNVPLMCVCLLGDSDAGAACTPPSSSTARTEIETSAPHAAPEPRYHLHLTASGHGVWRDVALVRAPYHKSRACARAMR